MTTKRVRRSAAPGFLYEALGYQISSQTLANLASLGEGPAYVLAGKFAEYEPDDLLAWGKARITPKTTKASELRESQAA